MGEPYEHTLRDLDRFRQLIGLLEHRGFGEDRIAKIMGGNFLAHAARVW